MLTGNFNCRKSEKEINNFNNYYSITQKIKSNKIRFQKETKLNKMIKKFVIR